MQTAASPRRHWLAAFLFIVVGGGLLIGALTAPGEWYAGLAKPDFNPPNWLFAPVWTVLYVLVAVAGWRVWRRDHQSLAMKLWWAQLGLNFLWSPVFFGMREIAAALAIVALLFLTILAFIVAVWRIDRASSLLFAPYAAWVGFATALNAAIFLLN